MSRPRSWTLCKGEIVLDSPAVAVLAEWLVHGVEILFHLGMDLDGSALQVVCGGVAWLIDRQISAARELYRGEQTPALVAWRVGDGDAPGRQVRQRLLNVGAHQVALVLSQPICGVDGNLGWWQLEDQPPTTGVDPGKSKHVTNEDPVGLCVGAVENDMCSVDHVSHISHFYR